MFVGYYYFQYVKEQMGVVNVVMVIVVNYCGFDIFGEVIVFFIVLIGVVVFFWRKKRERIVKVEGFVVFIIGVEFFFFVYSYVWCLYIYLWIFYFWWRFFRWSDDSYGIFVVVYGVYDL